MQLFKKTLGLIAVLCMVPAAYAANNPSRTTVSGTNTGRVGIVGNTASSRMPTLSVSSLNTTTNTTTSAALLANAECIDAYTACVKGADVCGENFEECTTKVLFHGKMSNCLSTLAQCSSSGVNSLFGTSNVSALANVASKNTYGEITEYTYPTDGSVLGQMITSAAISNRYDTSTCVRRYTSCLKKETVCGSDFELCTTDKEFRKQRVFCDSTLARCQSEGVIELLGSSSRTAMPTKTSRIGEAISEGAALAAVNAVSTCYKTVDQCILNACAENPYKCYENSNQSVVDLVDAINGGTTVTKELVENIVNKSAIAAYIKGACLDTIGGSKYCYATFIGNGQMPTNAQLRDEDNQEEIYDAAYSARMNNTMKTKIADLVDKFDTKAKQKCTETIKSCTMRVCGGGLGAACYAAVFGNTDKSINGSATYDEIKTGCAPIVNTDTYCKYSAANPDSTGTYSYTYINKDAFDVLFPEYDGGAAVDPIGVVATLNSSLATNYSDAAIANMKKRCQNVATSCVKSLCGNDYVNCYRNRTDIYSNLTNTGETSFDKSMNKVGGVLDYTIVLGLCLDTVKNASVCEEHLAIEANKIKLAGAGLSSWGESTNVRSGWIDAGSATSVTAETEKVQAVDENGNNLCSAKNGDQGPCDTVDDNGNVYDTPVMIEYTTYVQSQAASSLFKDLIYDIEKEAQAKYNAKLTKQQNMCLQGNEAGGIMGNRDNGSVYMWVKLKSNKVPKSYSTAGLQDNQFTASNDLYGSFCRIRVTLQSDDKNIQDKIRNGAKWSSAYFAAGDAFTCGSWIPSNVLETIADDVADKSVEGRRRSDKRLRNWLTVAGTLGGGYAGWALTDSLQDKEDGALRGLLNPKSSSKKSTSDYKDVARKCASSLSSYENEASVSTGLTWARQMVKVPGASEYGLTEDAIKAVEKASKDRANAPSCGTKKEIKTTKVGADTTKVAEANKKVEDAKVVFDRAIEEWNDTVCRANKGQGKPDCNDCPIKTRTAEGVEEALTHLKTGNTSRSGTNGGTCEGAKNYSTAAKAVRDALTSLQAAESDYDKVKSESGDETKEVEVQDCSKKSDDYIKADSDYRIAVANLRDACLMIVDNGINDEEINKAERRRETTNLIGTGVGMVAGGLIVNRLTKDIQKTQLDEAKRAAYEEWMNEVGNHIQCYIGSDEVGTYGDVIGTTLE